MALWLSLHINDQDIGDMEIRRREHLDLSDPAAIADKVCTYGVYVNGQYVGQVEHRYGDGAWRLLAAATNLYSPHAITQGHQYLSTGCYHGNHSYCNNADGRAGPKKPGRCKFCDAKCICSVCHEKKDTQQ